MRPRGAFPEERYKATPERIEEWAQNFLEMEQHS